MRSTQRHADVVVIGAGAAGLASAALVQRRGRSVIVLERGQRVGESWHQRYDGLRLNTVRWMSDLPGLRMGRRHGRWPTREEWTAYLERYASHHGLEIRFGVRAGRVERTAAGWSVETSEGAVAGSAMVVATGHDHTPIVPDWPGRVGFKGTVLHAADYRNPAPYRGRDVLVVGSGNSAFEIAAFVAEGGAEPVRVAVRTPPLILQREYLGIPVTPLGVPLQWFPDGLLDRLGRAAARIGFGDLSRYGLPRSPQRLSDMKRRYFAPPMDSGFVALVKRGAIEVMAALERFDGPEVVFADGRRVRPEVVIAATGYRPALGPLVGHLDVLTEHGEPRCRAGDAPANAPGLFFPGFRFGLLALLPYIELDARAIARAVDAQLDAISSEARTRT